MKVGSSELEILKVKIFLDEKFTIKDLSQARYFLGLELIRSKEGIYVNKRKYILDLIESAGLMGCKAATTPMTKRVKFKTNEGDLLDDPQSYMRIVGKLLYLGFTRPDIAFITQQLSQYVDAPRSSHWKGALNVIRYLEGTPSLGLFFPAENNLQLKGF